MASKIIVEGFKSIGERVEVEIRPLTLLAGANSSGKSSLMQSILLLKQTLEASYDPGALLLNGPNVKFTSIDQILHVGNAARDVFTVGFGASNGATFETQFGWSKSAKELRVNRFQHLSKSGQRSDLTPTMTSEEMLEAIPASLRPKSTKLLLELVQARFALGIVVGQLRSNLRVPVLPLSLSALLSALQDILHIPGLRGNPERSYPLAAAGPSFSGTFENYTASVIARWMKDDKAKVAKLGVHLKQLGLTWKVEAKKLDDANVELRVGRMPRPIRGGARDLVNIADLGFGVSQTLPVVVALLEARPGQLVFIEQPEIHLHPKAQVAMAGLLADAARRGVELVVETHSSLLLLAVQTLVAEGNLDPALVKLHWFTRDEKSGATKITSADLDEAGRFGDWPEDFDDVSLSAQSQYLDAVEAAVTRE
ncbi:MAG: AAA family ATPase [Planctomycetaceae bacterium]